MNGIIAVSQKFIDSNVSTERLNQKKANDSNLSTESFTPAVEANIFAKRLVCVFKSTKKRYTTDNKRYAGANQHSGDED